MRKAILVLSLLLLATGVAWAQVQTESLGDGARRIRAERAKKDLSKVRMFTNDNIGAVRGQISVVGGGAAAAPAGGEATATGEAAATGEAGAAEPSKEKQPATGCDEQCWRDKFRTKREKVKSAQKDLEMLQREFNLARVQYYQDPNQAVREQYSNNPSGGRQLQELQRQMTDKQAEIANLQRELSSLENELRRSGGDPGWARE